MLIIGVPFGKTSERLTAPVGLPPQDGTPPQDEQDPMAIMAAAPFAASRICSTIGLPATMQYTPPSLIGMEPSTTSTYLP